MSAPLARLAAQGKTPFYEGEIGQDLVLASRAKGGALEPSDLRAYQPKRRAPIHLSWEGYDIYTMPLPSAGGVLLGETLGTFSKAELAKLTLNSGAYQHTLAEAMRGALSIAFASWAIRTYRRWTPRACFDPRRGSRRGSDASPANARTPCRASTTTSTVRTTCWSSTRRATVASVTTTVNTAFGAKISGAQSGVVLNDELDDFTKQKDVAPFGLSQSLNRPRPGARPVSSMTPTIVVKDGKVVLAIGGSGGQLIATNVTQLLLARLAFGLSPAELVALPRFAVPTAGPSLLLEAGAAPALLDDLTWRGEVVQVMKENPSGVQVITRDDSGVSAAADPRKHGSALAK